MPRYIQVAMRRNGLHAVRGWLLNQLQICPGVAFDRSGNSLERESWFSWSIERYSVDDVLQLAGSQPFITLESFPLSYVLDVVERAGTDTTLIMHVRSLENWLASSLTLLRNRDGDSNMQLHRECVRIWADYVDYGKDLRPGLVFFFYDEWVKYKEYRQYVARKLGVHDSGRPYRRVHGIEYSSFDGQQFDGRADRMDVLHRGVDMMKDPELLHLVSLVRKIQ